MWRGCDRFSDEEGGELPKWAIRLHTYEEQSAKPIVSLIFSTQQSSSHMAPLQILEANILLH